MRFLPLIVCSVCVGYICAQTTPVQLDEVVVESKDGRSDRLYRQSQQVSALSTTELQAAHVMQPKDLSALVPNLIMPDYGSAMTSSIYIRGLGSRLDQPVMGLLINGIPILDKNLYDMAVQDLSKAEFLRGPQGTIYGRNTMGGILELYTLQPLQIQHQQVHAMLGYGTAHTVDAQASIYRKENESFGWSVAGSYRRTDGYYTNQFTGKKVDGGQQGSGRVMLDWKAGSWHVLHTLSGSYLKQGAFPYADAQTGIIAYNSPSSYERLALSASTKAELSQEAYQLTLMGTYQFLKDEMNMDQDFTPASIFTLQQQQAQHNLMLDAFFQGKNTPAWYRWSAGACALLKYNDLSAPVTFLREGIQTLILDNANKGIRQAFPNDSLDIAEQSFPIQSDFTLTNIAGALYHQSEFIPITNLHITLGLRLDVEQVGMRFDSRSSFNYRMTALMDNYKSFTMKMQGERYQFFFQYLPRLSVRYDFSKISLYAYAAKGSKTGGFNPQIFSTIMQNRMIRDLMADMGVHMPGLVNERYLNPNITAYKPETAWTGEIGFHWHPALSATQQLAFSADAFYTDVTDLQVTVFPEGKTTGRMMANAAHARSVGAEASLNYQLYIADVHFQLRGEYGFTDARFLSFSDGIGNYDGKRVPYAPAHTATLSASVSYALPCNSIWCPKNIGVFVQGSGQGDIYWNESNSLRQPFYALLSSSLFVQWKHLTLELWGKNLTDTDYDVFNFVSMSKNYLQAGRPRTLGITLRCALNKE